MPPTESSPTPAVRALIAMRRTPLSWAPGWSMSGHRGHLIRCDGMEVAGSCDFTSLDAAPGFVVSITDDPCIERFGNDPAFGGPDDGTARLEARTPREAVMEVNRRWPIDEVGPVEPVPSLEGAMPEETTERVVYLLRRAAERLRQSTPFAALAESCDRTAWELTAGAAELPELHCTRVVLTENGPRQCVAELGHKGACVPQASEMVLDKPHPAYSLATPAGVTSGNLSRSIEEEQGIFVNTFLTARPGFERRVQTERLPSGGISPDLLMRVWWVPGDNAADFEVVHKIVRESGLEILGVSTAVGSPESSRRSQACPGCEGELAGLVDAVCARCREQIGEAFGAFAPGSILLDPACREVVRRVFEHASLGNYTAFASPFNLRKMLVERGVSEPDQQRFLVAVGGGVP